MESKLGVKPGGGWILSKMRCLSFARSGLNVCPREGIMMDSRAEAHLDLKLEIKAPELGEKQISPIQ